MSSSWTTFKKQFLRTAKAVAAHRHQAPIAAGSPKGMRFLM
jgi:hypothetical protein